MDTLDKYCFITFIMQRIKATKALRKCIGFAGKAKLKFNEKRFLNMIANFDAILNRETIQ